MTDYKSMFEQAVRTLAAIDEALGIGDDGCGDPDQTLTAIDDLKAMAQRGEALALKVMGDQTAHDHAYALGLLTDCAAIIKTIEGEDSDEAEKLNDLLSAIDRALDPSRHKGALL